MPQARFADKKMAENNAPPFSYCLALTANALLRARRRVRGVLSSFTLTLKFDAAGALFCTGKLAA